MVSKSQFVVPATHWVPDGQIIATKSRHFMPNHFKPKSRCLFGYGVDNFAAAF